MKTGDRLPNLEIELTDGSRVRVGRHPRDATIVIVLHDACDRCEQRFATMRDRSEAIDRWGARLLPTRDGDLRSTLGLLRGEAAIVVIDRYGMVWEVHTAGWHDHGDLPDAEAVEESAKYLGTQCPECGVLDRPYTGEWTTV